MQDSFTTKSAQTGVSMDNLDLFSKDNIPENWEERKDSRHCRFTIDDEKRDMVDLEAVGEIPDSGPAIVRMGDDDDFVAAVDEFLFDLLSVESDEGYVMG
jgi:hypothetical protein